MDKCHFWKTKFSIQNCFKRCGLVKQKETYKDDDVKSKIQIELKPHQVILKDNQTGVSYKKLFANYLRGAEHITIQDPFIRMPYQFKNLMEFCLMLGNIKKPESEIYLEVVTWNDEEHIPTSILYLEELRDSLLDIGIHLTYRIEKHHDRFIVAENGWKIALGRGLDIFDRIDGRFNIADLDQNIRKCKACELTFIKI